MQKNFFIAAGVFVLIVAIVLVVFLIMNGNTASNNSNTPNTIITNNTVNPATNSDTVQISISNMAFPAETTIKKGQTVVWTNNDSFSHTVTFNDGAIDSGTLTAGSTFSHTFNDVGSFDYHCIFHSNMVGKIVVE